MSHLSSSLYILQMEYSASKPHAICIPLPAQGHINPMLKLAKLLHLRGFHITFVHTEFNLHRLLTSSGGPDSLKGSPPDFVFEMISDGLPSTNPRGILDLPSLCLTLPSHGLSSFRELVRKLNDSSSSAGGVPPVSCMVSDGVMSFTLEVAKEFGIPEVILFTPSGAGMVGFLHFEELRERGYFPLKDECCLTDGYLDTVIDWIPGLGVVRLKDLPTFIRTTNPNDTMFNYNLQSINNSIEAQGLILNTFDELEGEAIDFIRTKFQKLYTIGPLSLLLLHQQQQQQLRCTEMDSIHSNLWEEDTECLHRLNKKEPKSVVYVNYGSLVIMTPEQLREFACGLADSKYSFLWVIRPDLVNGGDEVISAEFKEEIRGRGMFVGWCPQERVLSHPSVGGFLTHCGWNSTLESISEGVPVICWPFFAEQQMNCVYACERWGVGMEIESDVRRERVEEIVRELMEGDKGRQTRTRAVMWKERAEIAVKPGGSSYTNFENLVNHLKQEPAAIFDKTATSSFG